jgi:hypothetical protein
LFHLARSENLRHLDLSETSLNDVFRLIAGTVPPENADAAALAELVEKAMAFRRSLAPATRGPDASK